MHATEATPGTGSVQIAPPHTSGVRIGEVSLALTGDSPDQVLLSRELEEFQFESRDPDIEICVGWAEQLSGWPSQPVFDSGAVWTLFHDATDYVFDFVSPTLGIQPYKRLRVECDFRRAQLTLSRDALKKHRPIYPLEYPADELLITN